MKTPTKACLWYDPEGDYLEVIFESKEGFFEKTEHKRIRVKVDQEGNLLGFHIQGISHIKGTPFEIELVPKELVEAKED